MGSHCQDNQTDRLGWGRLDDIVLQLAAVQAGSGCGD